MLRLPDERVSLVFPCRDEADNLPSLLSSVPDYFDEVIVVDNCSVDGTFDVASSYADSRVRAIRCDEFDKFGCGYGAASLAGARAATGDWVVFSDADGTYPFQMSDELIMAGRADDYVAILGVRYPDDDIPAFLQLGVRTLNTELLLLHGWHARDSLTGFVIVRRDVLMSMLSDDSIDWSLGWDLSPQLKVELLRRLGHDGVLQFKVKQDNRMGGDTKQSYWRTGFGHLWWIARDRFVRGRA